MAGRREPLANVPNAVNSPFRTITASGKRTRAQAGDHRDAISGQPPSKKQIIEVPHDDVENVDPKKRQFVAVGAQNKLEEPFMKRTSNAPPTAFERKLASARGKKTAPQQRLEPQRGPSAENVETVRQWKRHYKKQFPSFVFYFDTPSDEVRQRTLRPLQHLGARDEKFFSRAVTHVITTRPIPPELTSTSPNEEENFPDNAMRPAQHPVPGHDQRRATNLLDANLQRRAQSQGLHRAHDVDPRRAQASSTDILSRARELGIKIWAVEKFTRIMKTILEPDNVDNGTTQDIRNHATVHKTASKPSKEVDLEQLLRNEKINGPADRDMTVAAQDMVSFKGCYIYIHDMDEKTKPVMVRDYPKPTSKEDGKWPQFRLTPAGRCPFIEDPAHTKKLQQMEREAAANAKAEQELAAQRRTRGASHLAPPPRPLAEREGNLRRSPRKLAQPPVGNMAKPLEPPKRLPTQRQSSAEGMPVLFGSAQQSLRGLPRMIGGEPMASGMQQSNVTSAIRSQAISSAAISSTAPGMHRRVGDSKEVSALRRQMLERNTNVPSNHSMPSSYMNDVRAAINDDNNPPPRAAKRKAQETLGVLHEDEEDTYDIPRPPHRKPPAPKKRKPVLKEAKPGYCENCRDKFDDFDDHVLSRKHRKFAMTQDNWKELDDLLVQLKRPHKVPQSA
ncbi:Cdc7p-Dbf4p kinase complex regulatory subunit [Saxophila tyrrhenica]|uniref:Cdc7p-Dbf4p kinase complex regulatory subunit n=1 Tax=Saxophila tyrrhenica TaxID=1690608 RepID=A0AAV9P3E3_9PEZI|nr:Cdc7p-Dbf4p kinase complex regulatory subunit [Saxophila tyrrhenica]